MQKITITITVGPTDDVDLYRWVAGLSDDERASASRQGLRHEMTAREHSARIHAVIDRVWGACMAAGGGAFAEREITERTRGMDHGERLSALRSLVKSGYLVDRTKSGGERGRPVKRYERIRDR